MVPTTDSIAKALMSFDKGILAADESTTNMSKRLKSIGVVDSEENGRRFRELLFSTPFLEEYINGIILFDATIHQSDSSGMPFSRLLESRGIITGIKVDKGLESLPNFPNEEVSHGLDGLRERLVEYYELGARFTKWRSVVHITDTTPSTTALRANAQTLAYYASVVQEKNMVPMVEPEVLFEGTHTLDRSAEVLHATLSILFEELRAYKVFLPGLILKTSMVLPGKESGIPLDQFSIARETVRILKDVVPKETGGVVFLSGGQTPVQATENLNTIAQIGDMPWPVTFSYSRALEEPVLETWKGVDGNINVAQKAFQHRLVLNVAARKGAYKREME